MGKSTLYHPVSLTTLRGAAEFGGWKLGKFRQVKVDRESNHAIYEVQIIKHPASLDDYSFASWRSVLSSLYSLDVTCALIWITKAGRYMALMESNLPMKEGDQ